MSAYHEAFWAFVGTTGPIIVLANVVTFGHSTDAIVRLRARDRNWAKVPGKNWASTELFRLLRLGHLGFVGVCFALSLALTILAALSLWQRTDIIAGSGVIALLIITFVLLFILGVCSASFKRRLSNFGESPGEEE
jgi:FtsH-binding integral membrane protein